MTIAIAMTAILGASLYTSMAIAFDARDRTRRQTQAPQLAAIALRVLQGDLASALPPGGGDGGGFVTAFLGTADRVEFYAIGRDFMATDQPEDPLSEGMRWIELSYRTDLERPALVRRVERNLLAASPAEPPEEMLLTGIAALTFRYYDGVSWLNEWDSTLHNDALPLAVEVTIELDEPSPIRPTQNYLVTQVIPLSCASLEAINATETE